MHTPIFSSIIEAMADQGIRFEKGLSDEEIMDVEGIYRVTFPPDLKTFLASGLPVSEGFINWRTKDKDEILHKLQLPVTLILFKVKYHDFWLASWGVKPCEPAMAHEVALGQLQSRPRLIPIYQYDYLPEAPHEAGNPVLSVSQSKILYKATDLVQFFIKNFQLALPDYYPAKAMKPITFWQQVVQ